MFFKDMTTNALGRISTKLDRLDWSYIWEVRESGQLLLTVHVWEENLDGDKTLVSNQFDNEHELNQYIDGY